MLENRVFGQAEGGQNGNMIDKHVNSYLRKCLTDKDHRGIN